MLTFLPWAPAFSFFSQGFPFEKYRPQRYCLSQAQRNNISPFLRGTEREARAFPFLPARLGFLSQAFLGSLPESRQRSANLLLLNAQPLNCCQTLPLIPTLWLYRLPRYLRSLFLGLFASALGFTRTATLSLLNKATKSPYTLHEFLPSTNRG